MFKFFRKVRQKLIQGNKFTKYLLYAVGEIILVVIGILIALTVNNLNQEKKLRVIEEKILNELHSNLIHDLKEIQVDIALMDRINLACKKVESNLANQDHPGDSLYIRRESPS